MVVAGATRALATGARCDGETETTMNLTQEQIDEAPLCATCYDYVDDCKVVLAEISDAERIWVHISNGVARCPGQEDDDTDDTAAPLTSPDNGQRLIDRRYVVGLTEDGHEVLGGAVTYLNYYGSPRG
jgi:hypothetical protein